MSGAKKIILLVGLGLAIFLITNQTLTLAATSRTENSAKDCQLQSELKALGVIKENTELGHLEKIKAELEIRKNALRKIVGCSIGEARLLRSKLELVSSSNKEIITLKTSLLAEIDQIISYYQSQSVGINNLDLLGSKNLAKDLLLWRSGNYNYLVGRVVSVITWVTSQELIKLADSRFNDIKKTIADLKVTDNDVLNLVQDAETNLKKAEETNQKAGKALQDSGPPGDRLAIIKDSLGALAEVYKNFFDIGEAINKILPH